jgi:hypothetical protein
MLASWMRPGGYFWNVGWPAPAWTKSPVSPAFGQSDMPPRNEFSYTFDNIGWRTACIERQRGEETVGQVLGEVAQADGLNSLPAFAPDRLATTTHFFVDLVFIPMIMRALFGEKLKLLRAEIGPHVSRSVAFFLAASQHGGVNWGLVPKR